MDNDTKIYLVYGQNCELRKDNGAKYELYSNTLDRVFGLVKGYELDGLVYAVVDDQGSDVLDYLYVYVEHAKETAPQVDPDILGVTFMGLTPGASGETGVDGKVTVSDSVNKSGKVRLQVNVAGGGDPATVEYQYGSTAVTWLSWGTDWKLTAALGSGKLYVKITTASDEYILLADIAGAAVSTPTLQSSSGDVTVSTSPNKVTIDKAYKGTITVNMLADVLSLTGSVNAADYIEITYRGGATTGTEIINGLNVGQFKVVVHGDAGTGSSEYTVEFST